MSAVTSVSFIVQLATAVAAGATGVTAYKGYRATGSPNLLRLCTSFALLSIGLALGAVASVVDDPVLSAVVMISGSALDAAGYFLLALSHFFTVRGEISGLGTLLLVPALSVSTLSWLNIAINAVSLYLLMYISAETLIFYFQYRSRATLISVTGLLLITASVLLEMVVVPSGDLALLFSCIKLLGFVILCSPVAILFRHRPEVKAS